VTMKMIQRTMAASWFEKKDAARLLIPVRVE
jgi:hypothetical protein